jgi:mono/diheme cytochrome c family protein
LILIALALLWPKAALLGFGAALLANLALGLAEVSSFWPTLAVIGLAAAAGGPLLALVLRSDLAVGLFLAGIVAAYLVALGVDGSAVALSQFGPSQNSRFYGLSNFLETMLLVPALGGALFLWRRLGWPAFAGIALLSFVTVAGNRFGADGGGAIVLAVAFPLLAILLAGLRGRRLVVAAGTAVGVAAGLLVLDAVTGPESHVSRALDSGPSGIAADLRDRVELSWERVSQQAGIAAVVAVCLPVLVILVVRLVRSNAPLERRALPRSHRRLGGVYRRRGRYASRPMRCALAVTGILAGLAILVAGCGSATVVSPTAETVEGALPTEPTQTVNTSKGDPAAGKEVFASAGCAGCHTFKAAGSSATIGPDLDTALQGKDAAFVLESIVDPNKEIAAGFQPNIMPSTFGESLSDEQLADLVAFLTQPSS